MQEAFKCASGGDMTDVAAIALLEQTLSDFLRKADLDAAGLNALTAHLDRMRAELGEATRRDIAERLRREPVGADPVRFHSALFRLTGDLYHYERILHSAALTGDGDGNDADPALIHYVYWCMLRQMFLYVAGPEKAAAFAACDLFRCYQSLLDVLARRWGPAPTPPPRPDRPLRRVAFVTNQFLGEQHQPSRDCFDFARRLRDDHKLDTLIINANLLPMVPVSLFVPPFLSEPVTEYEGLKRVRMFDHEIPVASFTGRAFTAEKFHAIFAMVERFNPDVVVGFGGSNLITDLYARDRARPTITIPTTAGLTVSQADYILAYDRHDWTADLPPIYRQPFVGRWRPFYFGFSPPPLSAPGADSYALPADKAVPAVVGTRLDEEVTPAFIAVLERILDRTDAAVIAFAGGGDALPARLAASRHADRLLSLGHVQDIRSFYRRCAVFLNPPRQGGGGGAAFAMAEGVPVITHSQGDAAALAGPSAHVADDDAFVARTVALISDPVLHAAAATDARKRFAEVCDRGRSVADLAAYCHEIIRV
jgi:glycosyltransferase involved in cell wall biosynthesis